MFPEAYVSCECRQRSILDKRCTQAAQVTFRRHRKGSENDFGYDEIKHGVAEKLESLVVVSACTAVRQCLLKQASIVELIIQRFIEPGLGLICHYRSFMLVRAPTVAMAVRL